MASIVESMMRAGGRFATYADRLLALAFAAVSQLEIWVFDPDPGRSIAFLLAINVFTLTASLALAWRRSRPLLAFVVNGLAVYATIAVGFPSDVYQWTNLVTTYSVAAHGTIAQAWGALPFALGGVFFYFLRFPSEGGLVVAAFAAASWLVAWLAGRMYGARVEEMRLRAERDLSVQLAEAQRERLEVEAERSRIARELHDIIGHSVNVMVIHAGAGRRSLGDDEATARGAFETIETTGRAALGELDRVLAILRRDNSAAELSPAPGLAQLEALARTFEDAGLPVKVEVRGDRADVPPSVALSAYRIVQEALTNTLKHAEARRATVGVSISSGSVELSVEDDGVGLPAPAEAGRGIAGMRERAAIHGGSLAMSTLERGTSVTATLRWEAAK
jgi:signal transduction histidine kinase